ncbi:sulfite exporter TauE/SafE family protein [Mammaliicoccus sp. Dog046]|uniref:sulfite exporter TauE/SafE family protein n=1 Tax=Mammaliicoccus sp. Dog046 TaxID=3034233 RepID=UPI002B258536|nr:TSUP family transporter [Mammaliicoccus sp. Dog046]WQK86441.1 TSUP family transporter [Mammaliicoccus sp. Dog046]
MEFDLNTLLIIILFGLIASFIDSVVGGGGLISFPALLAVGMDPAVALGTNKLASSFGTLTSTLKFVKAKKVDFDIVGKLFPLSFIGSILGAITATYLPPEYFKPLAIIILTLVTFYSILKKDWGDINQYKKLSLKKAILFIVGVVVIGYYDGFIGGGTGSFFLFVLLLIGLDFLHAAGNAKFLNLASNLGALILFMVLGQVNYIYGLSMAGAMVVGSYLGVTFAIRKGVSYVKVLFIVVTISLILKNVYDYVTSHIL